MSRTRRGNRSPGTEYWTKRPGNEGGGGLLGGDQKRWTHRAERRQAKEECERGRDEG